MASPCRASRRAERGAVGFERYHDDLEAVLRFEARARWARARGAPVPEPPGDLDDRSADLVSGAGLGALADETAGAEPGDRRAWLRAVVARLAVAHRTREEQRECAVALGHLRWPDDHGAAPPTAAPSGG